MQVLDAGVVLLVLAVCCCAAAAAQDEYGLSHSIRGLQGRKLLQPSPASHGLPTAYFQRALHETLTAQARALLQGGSPAHSQQDVKKEDNKGSDKKEEKTDAKKVEEKKDGGNLPVWGPSDTKADQSKGGNANQDKKDDKANNGNTPVWGPADTYEKIKGRGGC